MHSSLTAPCPPFMPPPPTPLEWLTWYSQPQFKNYLKCGKLSCWLLLQWMAWKVINCWKTCENLVRIATTIGKLNFKTGVSWYFWMNNETGFPRDSYICDWIWKITLMGAFETLNMWPDLRKGVFHTHPIYQLWQSITPDWKKLMTWNLVNSEYQHSLMDGENVRLICYLNTKIWSSKLIELDVCGRPLFANPVTIILYSSETQHYKLKSRVE